MTAPSWRSSLVVQGFVFPNGDRVPVAVGLVDTAAGDVNVVLRVGETGDWVLLRVQDAARLEQHVREVLAERSQLTMNKLTGGDDGDGS